MQKTFTLFALFTMLMLVSCNASTEADQSTDSREEGVLPISEAPAAINSDEMFGHEQARDVAVAHVVGLTGLPVPAGEWSSLDQIQQTQDEDFSEIFANGPWVVQVSAPALSTEPIEYSVVLDHMSAIIRWEGRVDSYGNIVETTFIQGTQPDAPEEADEPTWIGVIVSNPLGAQFEDYFQMMDQNGTRCGINGADDTLEEQLISYRDTGTVIQVWGILQKDVPDSYGTQILVTRIEPY